MRVVVEEGVRGCTKTIGRKEGSRGSGYLLLSITASIATARKLTTCHHHNAASTYFAPLQAQELHTPRAQQPAHATCVTGHTL